MTKPEIFFLAVLPPQPVKKKARAISKEFAERYESKAAARSVPHITLVETFTLHPDVLANVVRAVEKTLAPFGPFSTELKDFAGFAEHTIYIKVLNKNPFQVLAYKLQSLLKHQFAIQVKASPNSHLTVGYKDLSAENYRIALAEFSKRTFGETLQVGSVCLLRQDYGWKVAKEFPLTGAGGYDSPQLQLFPG